MLLKPVNMASLCLEGIRKVYDKKVTAVSDFNLKIKDKEFVVLVGPSGCGKSTTLRMVAGLEEISGGELYIGDKLMNDIPPKDRDIAMVFQNYALYPHMTVFENMAFALKLRKVPKKEIEKRVNAAAEILEITNLIQRRPKQLSGGQRQRVAIGRAIVREPKVFLMDEPLSNLDAKLRNQMRAEIIQLRHRIDTTFIYVTHDQTEAMTLGDRIVVMKDGFIQQIGTPQEVFSHPNNMFVAGFIGAPQMNFFSDVNLFINDGKYTVEMFGICTELPEEKQKILHKKKQQPISVILGIRPEYLIVTDSPGHNSICAKVDVSEMLGSEMLLHVSINNQNAVLRVQQPDMINAYRFDAEETSIHFTLDGRKIHLFDTDTNCSLFYGS